MEASAAVMVQQLYFEHVCILNTHTNKEKIGCAFTNFLKALFSLIASYRHLLRVLRKTLVSFPKTKPDG